MTRSNNHVQLIGNLGQAPELKTLDSGKKLCSVSLATNESYLNQAGEKIENVHWHRITAWGKTAEILSSLDKGARTLVSGKLQQRTYDDKDGVKQYVTEVQVNEVYALASINQPVEA